jgi:5-methylcytosine-specific restriction endonuclease McrA
MHQNPQGIENEPGMNPEAPLYKECVNCNLQKPIREFLRRTGKRSGTASRRGTCKDCRMKRGLEKKPEEAPRALLQHRGRRILPALPAPLPVPPGPDVSILSPTRLGFVRMRGKTDRGRGWHQETDLETAVTLVKEHAAIVVNRHTIRRLYSNKMFRQYILSRDGYTCYFCGQYGDTIDHLLPRAKGGHTTPVNCVCACNLCNQTKADRNVDEFMYAADSANR